jgi:hypothetical protein
MLQKLEIENNAAVNYGADLTHFEEVRSERVGSNTQRNPSNEPVVDAAPCFPTY